MKKQIVIVHGGNVYDSYEDYFENLKGKNLEYKDLFRSDWKVLISNELGNDNEVVVVRMPNKENAKYSEWKIWFDKVVPFIRTDAILIGHSLGGIFLAKYLSENTLNAKALFMVGAPFDESEFVDTLGDFTLGNDLSNIGKQIKTINIYHSKDDPIVPFSDMDKYKEKLEKANCFVFEDRKHFWDDNFPEIIEDIKKLL